MKYYLDYNNGNIFKNLDETRFNVTTDFNKRATHYLLLSDEQVAYKEAHPYANPYDIWNMTMEEPIIEEPIVDTLQSLKENILKEIERHDKSVNVNLFYVNGEGAWLDKNERVSIRNTINIIKESGANAFSIWINNKNYIASCDIIMDLLNKLEIYAMNCFNVTQQHIANINNSISEEYILTYNFKENYPNKLYFTL